MQRRNLWRYSVLVALALHLGPRSFSWRRWVWGSLLTTLEYWPGWTSWRWWALFLRHPDLWWFCRRLELHYLFGFPKPALSNERLEA